MRQPRRPPRGLRVCVHVHQSPYLARDAPDATDPLWSNPGEAPLLSNQESLSARFLRGDALSECASSYGIISCKLRCVVQDPAPAAP